METEIFLSCAHDPGVVRV